MIRRLLDRSYVWPAAVAAAVAWQWITAPRPVAWLVTWFVVAALIAGALAADGWLRHAHANDIKWLEQYEAELDDADALRALVDVLCATKRRSPAENQAIRDLRAHMAALSVVEDESGAAA